jgi:hypothetical protein
MAPILFVRCDTKHICVVSRSQPAVRIWRRANEGILKFETQAASEMKSSHASLAPGDAIDRKTRRLAEMATSLPAARIGFGANITTARRPGETRKGWMAAMTGAIHQGAVRPREEG